MEVAEIRRSLSDELHARAFHDFQGAGRLIRFVYLGAPDDAAVSDYINEFLRHAWQAPLAASAKFVRLELDNYALRVERHTEFLSISFVQKHKKQKQGLLPDAFDFVASDLPLKWAQNVPAPLFNAIWLEIGGKAPKNVGVEHMLALLDSRAVAANMLSEGDAQAHFAFDIDNNGFSRIALFNEAITASRMGRIVQRVLELETYRLLALLGLATVREHSPALSRLEGLVGNLTNDLAEQIKQPGHHVQQSLSLLSGQAADLEEIQSQTAYRMAATAAYEAILNDRIEGLRLTRLTGFQGVRGFLQRRMTPAMDSCRAFEARLARLSSRITRAGDLLRTQTEMIIQNQNRDLLESMNERGSQQLRLQVTVERLSIAAVTYYGVGLVGYLIKPLPLDAWGIDPLFVKAAAVPIIALAVLAAVRSIHPRKRTRK